ncbi:hypothetical protein G6F37_009778 [Rhizopus arrhizus]|nr:hypothetical protein G6F37_009778 [Rhizopus arrhizus]
MISVLHRRRPLVLSPDDIHTLMLISDSRRSDGFDRQPYTEGRVTDCEEVSLQDETKKSQVPGGRWRQPRLVHNILL